MSASMIAARMLGGEEVELVQCAAPEPGPGEVRLRVEGCGVCASNLPLWQGRSWFEYPRQPGEGGHEAWGVVDAHGPGVRDPPLGTRVACLSEHAFAEYDVAAAESLVALPRNWGQRPAPLEPLGCAVNIFRRAGVRPGQKVAIVGLGFLGILLTQLTAHAGARAIAISRHAFALDTALDMGAHLALPCEGGADSIVATVDEVTEGLGCERVIEVTGKQEPLDLAGRLTGVRGRLVIAGYHQDGRREIDMQLWNWRGLEVINAHERDPARRTAAMRDALARIGAGTLDPDPLYSLRVPLPQLSSALAAVAERPRGFFKAVVEVG